MRWVLVCGIAGGLTNAGIVYGIRTEALVFAPIAVASWAKMWWEYGKEAS